MLTLVHEQTITHRIFGCLASVMNRGRRRERVFQDDEDYLRFIALLQEAVQLWDVRIAAFCLMPY